MPIYDMKCSCGHIEQNVWSGVNEYPPCPKCSEPMQRIIGNYHVVPDLQPYLDPHIGPEPTYVKSKQHRRELMKQFGVAEKFGKGWV